MRSLPGEYSGGREVQIFSDVSIVVIYTFQYL